MSDTTSAEAAFNRGVIIFIVALAILWPAYSIWRFNNPRPAKPTQPKPPWNDSAVEFEARAACFTAVQQRLYDPSSADFPMLDAPRVEIRYNDKVSVGGWLHANNRLGLEIRLDYVCELQINRDARKAAVLAANVYQR